VEQAWKLAQEGFYVHPVKNKVPLLKEWQNRSSKKLEELISMFQGLEGSDTNQIGIHCGKSGLVVLDIDPPNGKASIENLELTHGSLPKTLSQTTPRGGKHLIYKEVSSLNVVNSTSKIGKDLDVRAKEGYIVYYGWDEPKLEIVDCNPLWLYRMATKSYQLIALDGPDGELAQLRAASNGARNSQLNKAALKLGHHIVQGLNEDYVRVLLTKVAVQLGLSEEEAEKTITSGFLEGKKLPATASIKGAFLGENPSIINGYTASRFSSVTIEKVEWYDKPWLPKVGLVGLAGSPGAGKSTLLAKEVAFLTNECGINVLYLTEREEDISRVIARLKAAGCNLNLVWNMKIDEEGQGNKFSREVVLRKDLIKVRDLVLKESIKVIYIDPGNSYFGIDEGAENYTETRALLELVANLAKELSILIKFVKHTKKAQVGSERLNSSALVYGSQAWTEVARIFPRLIALDERSREKLDLEEDPASHLLLVGKNNFASPNLPAKALLMETVYDEELGDDVTWFKEMGTRALTEDEIISKTTETILETKDRREHEDRVSVWLINLLKEQKDGISRETVVGLAKDSKIASRASLDRRVRALKEKGYIETDYIDSSKGKWRLTDFYRSKNTSPKM